jgi:hypothetical protein
VPDGLSPLSVAMMVTCVPTTAVDPGLAVVVTVKVPAPVADAGELASSDTPATINTDAAPIATAEENRPLRGRRAKEIVGNFMMRASSQFEVLNHNLRKLYQCYFRKPGERGTNDNQGIRSKICEIRGVYPSKHFRNLRRAHHYAKPRVSS